MWVTSSVTLAASFIRHPPSRVELDVAPERVTGHRANRQDRAGLPVNYGEAIYTQPSLNFYDLGPPQFPIAGPSDVTPWAWIIGQVVTRMVHSECRKGAADEYVAIHANLK